MRAQAPQSRLCCGCTPAGFRFRRRPGDETSGRQRTTSPGARNVGVQSRQMYDDISMSTFRLKTRLKKKHSRTRGKYHKTPSFYDRTELNTEFMEFVINQINNLKAKKILSTSQYNEKRIYASSNSIKT